MRTALSAVDTGVSTLWGGRCALAPPSLCIPRVQRTAIQRMCWRLQCCVLSWLGGSACKRQRWRVARDQQEPCAAC